MARCKRPEYIIRSEDPAFDVVDHRPEGRVPHSGIYIVPGAGMKLLLNMRGNFHPRTIMSITSDRETYDGNYSYVLGSELISIMGAVYLDAFFFAQKAFIRLD